MLISCLLFWRYILMLLEETEIKGFWNQHLKLTKQVWTEGKEIIRKREAAITAMVVTLILHNKLDYFATISNQLSSNKKTLNLFAENKSSEHNISYFCNLPSLAFSSSSFSSKVGRKNLLTAEYNFIEHLFLSFVVNSLVCQYLFYK